MRLPLPTGGEHIPLLDPNAEVGVGEGEAQVTIPRSSLSHDTFQSVDSLKYVTLSTRQFPRVPADVLDRVDRRRTSRADLAVARRGGTGSVYAGRRVSRHGARTA